VFFEGNAPRIVKYRLMHCRRIVQLVLLVAGITRSGISADFVSVVVTTSLLEQAVYDVSEHDPGIRVNRLIPPGACPGHFDLSPDMLPVLKSAHVLILHDFQKGLENKIRKRFGSGLRTLIIESPGSHLIPGNYLRILRKVSDALPDIESVKRGRIEARLSRLEERCQTISKHMRETAVSWKNFPVIVSVQQAHFAQWLGFRVTGILRSPEHMSPPELTALIQSQAQMILCNLQGGIHAAENLGIRMNIPVAVISNFPDAGGFGNGYESLVDHNLKRIAEAVARISRKPASLHKKRK